MAKKKYSPVRRQPGQESVHDVSYVIRLESPAGFVNPPKIYTQVSGTVYAGQIRTVAEREKQGFSPGEIAGELRIPEAVVNLLLHELGIGR